MKKTILSLVLVSSALLSTTFANTNSQNSTIGTYKGTLSCASCQGIETTIQLNPDNSFVQTSNYLTTKPGNKIFVDSGSYNMQNGIVSLNNEEKTQLKIENDKAIILVDGKVSSGDLADTYILKKDTQISKNQTDKNIEQKKLASSNSNKASKTDQLTKVSSSSLSSKIAKKLQVKNPNRVFGILDTKNSQNTVDGIYKGTLACGDCEGIEATLKLINGKYIMSSKYIGKPGVFEDKGTYNLQNNILTLSGDLNNIYKIENNTLTATDVEFPDMYTMTK